MFKLFRHKKEEPEPLPSPFPERANRNADRTPPRSPQENHYTSQNWESPTLPARRFPRRQEVNEYEEIVEIENLGQAPHPPESEESPPQLPARRLVPTPPDGTPTERHQVGRAAIDLPVDSNDEDSDSEGTFFFVDHNQTLNSLAKAAVATEENDYIFGDDVPIAVPEEDDGDDDRLTPQQIRTLGAMAGQSSNCVQDKERFAEAKHQPEPSNTLFSMIPHSLPELSQCNALETLDYPVDAENMSETKTRSDNINILEDPKHEPRPNNVQSSEASYAQDTQYTDRDQLVGDGIYDHPRNSFALPQLQAQHKSNLESCTNPYSMENLAVCDSDVAQGSQTQGQFPAVANHHSVNPDLNSLSSDIPVQKKAGKTHSAVTTSLQAAESTHQHYGSDASNSLLEDFANQKPYSLAMGEIDQEINIQDPYSLATSVPDAQNGSQCLYGLATSVPDAKTGSQCLYGLATSVPDAQTGSQGLYGLATSVPDAQTGSQGLYGLATSLPDAQTGSQGLYCHATSVPDAQTGSQGLYGLATSVPDAKTGSQCLYGLATSVPNAQTGSQGLYCLATSVPDAQTGSQGLYGLATSAPDAQTGSQGLYGLATSVPDAKTGSQCLYGLATSVPNAQTGSQGLYGLATSVPDAKTGSQGLYGLATSVPDAQTGSQGLYGLATSVPDAQTGSQGLYGLATSAPDAQTGSQGLYGLATSVPDAQTDSQGLYVLATSVPDAQTGSQGLYGLATSVPGAQTGSQGLYGLATSVPDAHSGSQGIYVLATSVPDAPNTNQDPYSPTVPSTGNGTHISYSPATTQSTDEDSWPASYHPQNPRSLDNLGKPVETSIPGRPIKSPGTGQKKESVVLYHDADEFLRSRGLLQNITYDTDEKISPQLTKSSDNKMQNLQCLKETASNPETNKGTQKNGTKLQRGKAFKSNASSSSGKSSPNSCSSNTCDTTTAGMGSGNLTNIKGLTLNIDMAKGNRPLPPLPVPDDDSNRSKQVSLSRSAPSSATVGVMSPHKPQTAPCFRPKPPSPISDDESLCLTKKLWSRPPAPDPMSDDKSLISVKTTTPSFKPKPPPPVSEDKSLCSEKIHFPRPLAPEPVPEDKRLVTRKISLPVPRPPAPDPVSGDKRLVTRKISLPEPRPPAPDPVSEDESMPSLDRGKTAVFRPPAPPPPESDEEVSKGEAALSATIPAVEPMTPATRNFPSPPATGATQLLKDLAPLQVPDENKNKVVMFTREATTSHERQDILTPSSPRTDGSQVIMRESCEGEDRGVDSNTVTSPVPKPRRSLRLAADNRENENATGEQTRTPLVESIKKKSSRTPTDSTSDRPIPLRRSHDNVSLSVKERIAFLEKASKTAQETVSITAQWKRNHDSDKRASSVGDTRNDTSHPSFSSPGDSARTRFQSTSSPNLLRNRSSRDSREAWEPKSRSKTPRVSPSTTLSSESDVTKAKTSKNAQPTDWGSMVPPPSVPENIEDYEWYFGDIDRQKARNELNSLNEDGGFLVRKSQRGGLKQPYTLVIYDRYIIYNLPIRQLSHSSYALGSVTAGHEAHVSVGALIAAYRTFPIVLEGRKGTSSTTVCLKKCPPNPRFS